MSPLLIPILGICCGLLAIFAGAIFRPWMKLKERQMELDAHAKKAKAEPTNWGLTGDLSNVRSGLVELVTFMSGMDEDEVAEFLSEDQHQAE